MDIDLDCHTDVALVKKETDFKINREEVKEDIISHSDYNLLSNKITEVQTLVKELIILSQQIFLHTEDTISNHTFSNQSKSLHFDNIAGPLVNAIDLFTSSLKSLEDIYLIEEKYELDCCDPLNQHSIKLKEDSQSQFCDNFKTVNNDCFIQLTDCSKSVTKSFKNEFYFDEKIKQNADSTNIGFDIKEDNNEKLNIDIQKTRLRSNKLSEIDYCEVTNDWTSDDDDSKENGTAIKFESKSKKYKDRDSDINDNKLTENLEEDHEQSKTGQKRKRKKQMKEQKCDLCDFITFDKMLFMYHIRGLLGLKKCALCSDPIMTGEMTKDVNSADQYFEDHIKKKHSDLYKTETKEFICRECSQVFGSVSEYDNHLTDQHNLVYNYHCKAKCGFTSTKLEIIKNHLNEEHLKCRLCPAKFRFLRQIEEHIEERHNNPTACDICGKKFESKHKLNYHLRDEHARIPESGWSCCQICGKIYPTNHLPIHMKQTHSQGSFKCNECDYTTTHKNYLSLHIKNLHSAEQFLCDLCPYVGSKLQLKSHNYKFHNENKIPCDQCDLSFPNNSTLKRHINKAHSKIDKRVTFTCTELDCGQEFYSNHALKSHIDKEHKGIKWPCTKCDYVGISNQCLKVHIKLVHKGVGLKCNKCEFITSHKSRLIKHLRNIHQEGEDIILSCDRCDFKTNIARKLNEHKQHIHDGKSYKCFHCSNSSLYNSRRNYKMHMIRKHKIAASKNDCKQALVIDK